MSGDFSSFLFEKEIYTPQQNGVVEWKIWHIMVTVRALLIESSLSPTFWCEAAHMAIHLISHLPVFILNNMCGTSLSYFHLCAFGCVGFVHLPSHEWIKLASNEMCFSQIQ